MKKHVVEKGCFFLCKKKKKREELFGRKNSEWSNWMDTVKSNNLRNKIWNVNKDANKSIEI